MKKSIEVTNSNQETGFISDKITIATKSDENQNIITLPSSSLQLDRSRFLKLGIAVGLTMKTLSFSGVSGASKRPYKVLWNDDTTNIPNWNDPNPTMTNEKLQNAINSVAGKGIDAYMLAPGLCWIPWWKSKVYPDHYQWRLEKYGVQPDCFGKYMMAGGDLVDALIKHCRKIKIAPFVSFRLNDNHYQENFGKNNPQSIWVSRFYEEHPEYMLNPKHSEIKGYSKERGQNWAIPEVRGYKLALIKELCENYDLEGIELDFLRDDNLFRQNETTDEQRAAWIVDFVRSVRAALNNGPDKNRRRYLCVRIPCEVGKHGRSGINVDRFAEAGVDMFNLSNWYHTSQLTDLSSVRKLVPRAAIYLEMHYTTSNKMASGYSTSAFPKTSNEQFYTTAHLAYKRGADGVSFFNMQYNKSSYQVLPQISKRAWLAKQPQYYFLGNVPYYRQLPVTLAPDKTLTFKLDMAPPDSFPRKKIRVRIHTENPLRNTVCEAILNGHRLETCDDVSAFFNNPYDEMISTAAERMAFKANRIDLINGINMLSLTLKSENEIRITYIDVMVEKA
jgi:hypothetical protein